MSEKSFFPDSSQVSLVIPVFKNVRELSADKNYFSVSLLSVVNKVFEKLVNNKIVDHLEKFGRTVLGLLNQLQIFRQLYLIELVELLTVLELL